MTASMHQLVLVGTAIAVVPLWIEEVAHPRRPHLQIYLGDSPLCDALAAGDANVDARVVAIVNCDEDQ